MSTSSVSERKSQAALVNELNKSYYQADQQAKFKNLEAEVDSLLQQLQNLKEQRLAATHSDEE
ncbi:hypothetical protein H6G80_20465 [Nostoc sp. FACHB-87]|uniref:hypothetical protein n=1 Tax=Nostocales TaxID=1161 RepID=UPI001687651B|nr:MULTISPECIES: hypothetical protein [Nostocales]MBD2298430.1 hypothetical protein [Nostoc sp. FACHB-190]MBD2456438.1 hypothetical protein [Nostoc sp. FACHB-87]MBD2474019.1 hypothetical protein [Anabaena sp. FACHB-83]MBD2488615.1 hypothetical protein [Aulosira sp. FACHB-615]MBD2497052.1 hypothetical protein [Nostoc sp. FACHB-280]